MGEFSGQSRLLRRGRIKRGDPVGKMEVEILHVLAGEFAAQYHRRGRPTGIAGLNRGQQDIMLAAPCSELG
jgi:hypothetical protein